MKKEKSILIIENSNHYHVLDHLCDFYKNKGYEVTLALTWTMDKDMIIDMFEDYKSFKIIDIKSKNFFFWKLLFKRKDYDYIHISTGAENTYLKFLLNIFIFFIFTFFNKKKIILQIRNTKYYLISKNIKKYFKVNFKKYKKVFFFNFLIYSFSNFFRSLTLKNCIACIFESNTQLIFFNRYTNNKFSNKGYYLYSANLKKEIVTSHASHVKITIGVPGSYSPQRRNYDTLITALSTISDTNCSKIKLIFVGNFSNIDSYYLNFFKKKKIEVIYFQKFVSTENYKLIMGDCDYILSLHKKEGHPFTFAGSGIIGDLSSFRLKMIINYIFDPFGEFYKKSIYYSDLSILFKRLLDNNFNKSDFISNKKNKLINCKYNYLHNFKI